MLLVTNLLDNFELLAVAIAIGGLLFSLIKGLIELLIKLIDKKRAKPVTKVNLEKYNVVIATKQNMEIFHEINDIALRYGRTIVRVTTSETLNGGGVPKPGYPTYVRMLLEDPGPNQVSIGKYWTEKTLCPPDYLQIIAGLLDRGSVLWTPNDLSHGPIKEMMTNHGIKTSWFFALGFVKKEENPDHDSFMFLTIDFNDKFKPTTQDKIYMASVVGNIKSVLSTNPSFEKY